MALSFPMLRGLSSPRHSYYDAYGQHW